MLPANGEEGEVHIGNMSFLRKSNLSSFAKTKSPCLLFLHTFVSVEQIFNVDIELVLDQVFVVNIWGKVAKVWESCRQQYMSENRRGMKRQNKLLIRQPTTGCQVSQNISNKSSLWKLQIYQKFKLPRKQKKGNTKDVCCRYWYDEERSQKLCFCSLNIICCKQNICISNVDVCFIADAFADVLYFDFAEFEEWVDSADKSMVAAFPYYIPYTFLMFLFLVLLFLFIVLFFELLTKSLVAAFPACQQKQSKLYHQRASSCSACLAIFILLVQPF